MIREKNKMENYHELKEKSVFIGAGAFEDYGG